MSGRDLGAGHKYSIRRITTANAAIARTRVRVLRASSHRRMGRKFTAELCPKLLMDPSLFGLSRLDGGWFKDWVRPKRRFRPFASYTFVICTSKRRQPHVSGATRAVAI